MKTVCHLANAFTRYDTRIFWKQCRSLAHAHYNTYLFVNDSQPSEEKDGVKILPWGHFFRNRLSRIFFSKHYYLSKAMKVDADVYQIHDPELIPLALELKKRGKLIVFDSHEDFPQQILEKFWIPKLLRKPLSLIAQQYLRKHLKSFDAVLCVSPHILEKLKKISNKVFLVTNYPIVDDTDKPCLLDDYLMKKNILCYAGTIYRSSNQKHILQALREIDNVEYYLVGDIDAQYKELLSKMAEWNKVVFIPRVSKERLKDIYSRSTIGIAVFDYSPNLGHHQGSLGVNKLFEYMYFGLPILSTDFLLWKNIIDKHQCGIYVKPNSFEEIRKAIVTLITEKENAFRMGENGRKAILKEYNWKTQEQVYLSVYKNLFKK